MKLTSKIATEFLSAMRQRCNSSRLPTTNKSLNKVLRIQSEGTSDLSKWIQYHQKSDTVGDMNKIRSSLLQGLSQMGAYSCEEGWNEDTVRKLILLSSPNPSDISQTKQETLEEIAIDLRPSEDVSGDVCLIDNVEELESFAQNFDDTMITVDCEGVPDELLLIQVATPKTTHVIDCIKLGPLVVCQNLKEILMNSSVTKIFHDLRNDAAALASLGAVTEMKGTLDTQLAMEFLTGDPFFGFNRVFQHLGTSQHFSKKMIQGMTHQTVNHFFSQRPLPRDVLQYAVDDVRLLVDAYDRLRERLADNWDVIQRASDMRARMAAANGGSRHVCFDIQNAYSVASYELLSVVRPEDIMTPAPLKVSNETDSLLNILPEDLQNALRDIRHDLCDVVLDKGRRPHAWTGRKRILLDDDSRLVEHQDIVSITKDLEFGSDNRAGFERQLHRISALRNRESEIYGLRPTLRAGRHVSGNTHIISDLLFANIDKSILFLGQPGTGKTTVVREVSRQLAERYNVCIVDRSNEIAGDGDIPHPCVGLARRMMVKSLDMLSTAMIECVQNHTPEVMVIDEIVRPQEVEAARTCKNRGVRLIASAHGDLRKLIENPKLCGLVGGVKSVTLGDKQAKMREGIFQKTKLERAEPPTFDIIVELKRGKHHEWRIILDAGRVVDLVLRGEECYIQRRIRDPDSSTIQLSFDSV